MERIRMNDTEMSLDQDFMRYASRDDLEVVTTRGAAAHFGLDFSRGDYRSLGYGEPLGSPARRIREGLSGDEYEDLMRATQMHEEELAHGHVPARLATSGGRSRSEPSLSYAGLGPKSYRRRDARIAEDLSQRLGVLLGPAARNVVLTVEDSVVILHGTVDRRAVRWLVEDIAEAIPGTRGVQNELRWR